MVKKIILSIIASIATILVSLLLIWGSNLIMSLIYNIIDVDYLILLVKKTLLVFGKFIDTLSCRTWLLKQFKIIEYTLLFTLYLVGFSAIFKKYMKYSLGLMYRHVWIDVIVILLLATTIIVMYDPRIGVVQNLCIYDAVSYINYFILNTIDFFNEDFFAGKASLLQYNFFDLSVALVAIYTCITLDDD